MNKTCLLCTKYHCKDDRIICSKGLYNTNPMKLDGIQMKERLLKATNCKYYKEIHIEEKKFYKYEKSNYSNWKQPQRKLGYYSTPTKQFNRNGYSLGSRAVSAYPPMEPIMNSIVNCESCGKIEVNGKISWTMELCDDCFNKQKE